MDKKLYTVAGTSILEGQGLKARFATDMLRQKVLEGCGHTDIKLVELPNPMLKEDALKHLLTLEQFNKDKESVDMLNASIAKLQPKPKKEKKAKETGTAPTTPAAPEPVVKKGKKAPAAPPAA